MTRPARLSQMPASKTHKARHSSALINSFILPAFILAVASCSTLQAQAQIPPKPAEPGSAEIIQGIDDAVHRRELAVAGYTVKDHYAIYRNGEAKPSAEMTVQTVFKRGAGKTITTLSQSGSGLLRSQVIEKVIAGEKEMSTGNIRDTVLVTSANYEMTPDTAKVQFNGKDCYVVALKARRKNPHVFNGKAWVDAADFSVVRLEGSPTQSPSFFAGDSTMARDYAKFDGIPMAIRAEAHSHSFLLGDTVLKIESTEYQIQHVP